MQLSYPLPKDEPGRLKALHELHVLDTEAEAAFDDLVRLASHICGTPISLVSLIDADRQWFKAKLGIDVEETPREVSFCTHALVEPDELFVVRDATADPRFAQNPAVLGDPGIRFYAAAPLVTRSGHAVGALCTIDRVPRDLTPEQKEALQALGRQVVSQLEIRLKVQELERKRRELTQAHEEKEVLLREIHHRVKNNLQVVTSLLQLQSGSVKDPAVKEHFRESQQRIRAMALIHEKLYQSLDLNDVNFSEYLRSLVPLLVRSCTRGAAVEAKLDLAPCVLNVDVAIPVGLITSELVSNSLKHGFAANGSGTLSVQLRCVDDRITVTVADTGSGLPAGFDPTASASLGMRLVHALTGQINGELAFASDNGARFQITFPRDGQ